MTSLPPAGISSALGPSLTATPIPGPAPIERLRDMPLIATVHGKVLHELALPSKDSPRTSPFKATTSLTEIVTARGATSPEMRQWIGGEAEVTGAFNDAVKAAQLLNFSSGKNIAIIEASEGQYHLGAIGKYQSSSSESKSVRAAYPPAVEPPTRTTTASSETELMNAHFGTDAPKEAARVAALRSTSPKALNFRLSNSVLRRMIPLDPAVKALVVDSGFFDLRNGELRVK